MRKILLFLILFPILMEGQNTEIPIESSDVKTTYEEYNFLTKVYPNSDNPKMLDGYELHDFFEITAENFNFNYKFLVKIETGEKKAVFVKITKIKKKDDKKRYLCIPFNNTRLIEKYYKDHEKIGISMSIAYDIINNTLLMKLLDEKYNTKRTPYNHT